MLVLLTTLVIIAQICSIKTQKHFPSDFPRCYRNDPKIGDCLVKATAQVKPFLQKGIPQFNIAPLSPYFIPEVRLEQGTGSLNYKNVITNLKITGLDSYDFTQFDFDAENLKFKGAVNMGKIDFVGDYAFEGKILSVPLQGRGKLYSSVDTSNGTLEQTARLVTRKGVKYLMPEDPVIKITVGEGITYKTEGLFDDNEQLKKATENLIKENMKEIIKEFIPAVNKVIEKIIQDILLKTVARVPYDELFPVSGSF